MKRSIALWQLGGLTFTAILGTVFHFLYQWTGNVAFAPFCAVNESTWEHMKILFFPMFFFALLQSIFFKAEHPDFWCIKLVGTTLGVVLIPILFYTYNGAFGKSPDWVNILIFFISAGCAYLAEAYLFKRPTPKKASVLPLILLILLALVFVLFTFLPPQIPLFQDPIPNSR